MIYEITQTFLRDIMTYTLLKTRGYYETEFRNYKVQSIFSVHNFHDMSHKIIQVYTASIQFLI
jgi:hypothetical protein